MKTLPQNFMFSSVCGGFRPVLAAMLCAGCVSPAERNLGTRETHIRATLATLKPDSTRAELNRLLPPSTPAVPHDTNVTDDSGTEIHPLDQDFSLVVKYRYQNYRQIRPLLQKEPDNRNGVTAIRLNLDPDKYYRVWPSPKDRVVGVVAGRKKTIDGLSAPGRPVWPAFAYWALSENQARKPR
jgi:hypothetical protein